MAGLQARLDGRVLDEAQDAQPASLERPRAETVRISWDQHHERVVDARRRQDLPEAVQNDERVGICCSGGGIRSAAFNLGALQALQRAQRLHTADYLAAVSGGAYIAGAMSILQLPHTPAGAGDVHAAPAGTFDALPPYALGSPEVRQLRNNSSYLAPGLAGRVRLVGYLLLGALLQLVAVIALLAAVALPTALLGLRFAPALRPDAALAHWAWAAPGLTLAGGVLVATGLLVALVAIGRRGADERGRHARAVASLLAIIGVVLLLVVAVLPWLTATGFRLAAALMSVDGDDALTRVLVALSAAGVPTVIVSALRLVAGQLTGARDGHRRRRFGLPEWSSWAAYVVTPLVIAALFGLLYVVGVRMGPGGAVVAWLAAVTVLALFYVVVDPNKSSMHTFYRERLGSAFATQRVRRGPHADTAPVEAQQRPYHERTVLSEAHDGIDAAGRMWPQLLICAAVNVSTHGATPTGRDAVPLVFSHDWVGGDEIGWVRTKRLEAALGSQRGLVTLLAAVAVSGAALSPSMGKMTSRPYRFLLGLVNARLGIWLPNPRFTGEAGSLDHAPRLSWQLRELIGRIGVDRDFVYVTDGGHYENLGLVELLRRRCTEIWCFDASGDPPESFTTLAQALAMARTDLDVDIDLRTADLRAGERRTPPPAERLLADRSWQVIDFTYSEPDGTATPARLIYVKCRVTADTPWDVTALYERDPRFPNHSTADQLYAEERFEAYRKLGEHLATKAFDEVLRTAPQHATGPRPAPSPDGDGGEDAHAAGRVQTGR